MAVKIFFCYAHEDEELLKKLKTHLRPLQRQGLIDVWHDRDIRAGAEWEEEISEHLNTAQIILLLVSPDFMDSDYCYGIEMQRAMERHKRREARVIPIILRPVYWQGAPFSTLQALPPDAKPVISWSNEDEAFFKVVEGISEIVGRLITQQQRAKVETERKAKEERLHSESAKATSKKASPDTTTPVGGEDANREREQSQHQAPQARRRATLLLSCFWMIIWGIILGTALYAFEILPIPVLRFAGAIAAVTTVFGVIIGQVTEPTATRDFFRTIWQNANHTLSVLGGLFAVIVILGGSYLVPVEYLGPPLVESTPTHGPPWVSILKQTAPNCNNSSGAEWYLHSGGTRYTCHSSGGVMEQTTSSYYAEMDLMKVKGSSYNQTNFRVQDDIAFQNPSDTSTWAALTVQSPTDTSIPGGYIFTLSSDGTCELQQVVSSQSIPTVGQASVNIDPHRLVQMMVIVQNGVLYAYINGKQVFTHPDNLNTSPSDVGLMIERQNAGPSSLVEFSNFALDEAG